MADIKFQCPNCSATRIVSEFVDASKLKCSACGELLRKPGDMPPPHVPEAKSDLSPISVNKTPPSIGSRLRVAQRQREEIEAEAATKSVPRVSTKPVTDVPKKDVRERLELHPKAKHKKDKVVSHTLLAFAFFLVLGIAMGYLRYGSMFALPGGGLPIEMLEKAQPYFWAGILVLHLMVVSKAMVDNMLHGVLCLLVPGWSLVYLLLISDNFYLRAFVLGSLVGIGQDGGMQVFVYATNIAHKIAAFIAAGGS